MSKFITEDQIEAYNLELLNALGYEYKHGKILEPEGVASERQSFSDVLLKDRLSQALTRINPHIPPDARHQAQRELQNIVSPDLITNNETFHRYLTEGITVEYQRNGETKGEQVWLIDWNTLENNEFLAVNQFTVIEDNHNRRPDIILFINGLPLVVIELKNAADAKANLKAAFNQLQTYKREIPSLFIYNALLVISDGISAKAGSLSADDTRFSRWKLPASGPSLSSPGPSQAEGEWSVGERAELEILTQGMLNKYTLLDLIRHFTVFEKIKTVDPKTEVVSVKTIKKLAAYHQYYAVNKAVESVLRAGSSPGPSLPSPDPSQAEGDRSVGEREDQMAYRGGLPVTTLLKRVRELRQKQTPAEAIFWEIVRAKRFYGLKFRRQHQIGNFIVDFYCHQYKLVIELDGGVHHRPKQQQYDQRRDAYLKSLGHTVLRFSNQAIFDDLETVLNTIAEQIPSPGPSLPSPGPSHLEAGLIYCNERN